MVETNDVGVPDWVGDKVYKHRFGKAKFGKGCIEDNGSLENKQHMHFVVCPAI